MTKYSIIRYKILDSTNDYAKDNINILKDKQVILAEKQKKGRGQFLRKWSSPCGNLYFTIILKKNVSFELVDNIIKITGVSLINIINNYGLEANIKLPNDILINNKKICGILCENIVIGNNIKAIILGIGINVNMTKNEVIKIEQPATSMKIELKEQQNINKEIVLNEFLNLFFDYYECIEKSLSEINKLWKKHLIKLS